MKGTYILLINLEKDTDIVVGALGEIRFRAGEYCYVGSAYGPGGIEARVARHMREEKSRRWHIDYLLEYAEITGVLVKENGDEVESARVLEERFVGVSGFGSSDSPLKSHLFMCPHRVALSLFPDFRAL